MEQYFRIAGDFIQVDIRALPGASKTELAGLQEGRLRIRIAAAPEDGRANGELRAFLAKTLGCAKKDISLLRGEKSRLKTLALPLSCLSRLKTVIEAHYFSVNRTG